VVTTYGAEARKLAAAPSGTRKIAVVAVKTARQDRSITAVEK
jgi:hypothetical protein